MNDVRMPSLFVGHGSPMNALQDNRYTRAWRTWGNALPRPRGILVISAHWFIGATAVTVMERPRTLHDFHGFPEELSAFDYPAPGLPELAEEVVEIAKPDRVELDRGQWGFDHGAWSVLAHLYPDADIPVIQLSLNAFKRADYHVQLGARLAALSARGVLVIASGNVVHNLRRIDWNSRDTAESWVERFDEAATSVMLERPDEVGALLEHPDYKLAAPTPDHFLPLLYIAGMAAAAGEGAAPLIRGGSLGSISMSCYGVGVDNMASMLADGVAAFSRDAHPQESGRRGLS